jgi:hypothetical protein
MRLLHRASSPPADMLRARSHSKHFPVPLPVTTKLGMAVAAMTVAFSLAACGQSSKTSSQSQVESSSQAKATRLSNAVATARREVTRLARSQESDPTIRCASMQLAPSVEFRCTGSESPRTVYSAPFGGNTQVAWWLVNCDISGGVKSHPTTITTRFLPTGGH